MVRFVWRRRRRYFCPSNMMKGAQYTESNALRSSINSKHRINHHQNEAKRSRVEKVNFARTSPCLIARSMTHFSEPIRIVQMMKEQHSTWKLLLRTYRAIATQQHHNIPQRNKIRQREREGQSGRKRRRTVYHIIL